jgi:hypothetical protein
LEQQRREPELIDDLETHRPGNLHRLSDIEVRNLQTFLSDYVIEGFTIDKDRLSTLDDLTEEAFKNRIAWKAEKRAKFILDPDLD